MANIATADDQLDWLNRRRYVKDRRTGKRVSRVNPESEWITTDVPALRIVRSRAAARFA